MRLLFKLIYGLGVCDCLEWQRFKLWGYHTF